MRFTLRSNFHMDPAIMPKRAAATWGKLWRCATLGGVALASFSAAVAGATSSAAHPKAVHRSASARTYVASAWPGLTSAPVPSAPIASPAPTPAAPAPAPTPASPAVVPIDPCANLPRTDTTPAAPTAPTTPAAPTTQTTTATLADVSLPSTVGSGLGSVLGGKSTSGSTSTSTSTTSPTGAGATSGGSSTSGQSTSGSSSTSSGSTTTTTTTPPRATKPTLGSLISPTTTTSTTTTTVPSGGSIDTNIGCGLIGSATLGQAVGETPTEVTAVNDAAKLLGILYLWGGESIKSGFDCSGLVQYVYREAGVSLPRVAQNQFDAGPAVPPGTVVEPGDLVFFGPSPTNVKHVGMYVGDGMMINAPYTGAVVRFDRVSSGGSIVGVTAPGS